MHQDHFVYRPDSTKVGKAIAMFLGGKLLGPDWSRYAVHHYAVKNNAIELYNAVQGLVEGGVMSKERAASFLHSMNSLRQ